MENQTEFPEEGMRVRFRDKSCFVCGQANPIGLHLEFRYDRENRSASTSVAFCDQHQGWDGVVHGGILAAVLDDVMAHAILTTDNLAITTHLKVTYREAIMVGEQVFLNGVVVELRPRAAKARGIIYTLSGDGSEVKDIKCEAEATYFLDSPRE
jgi:acyl-coenzyme A thioesterase PaaI-like protein